MLPPGEATAAAHVGRMADPQQLGRAGGRLDHQLPCQLLVEARVGAGVGDRFHGERQVGRGAAHHRGRRVELLVGQLDDVPEDLEQLPAPRAPRSPATQSTPRGPRPPTFGITRTTSAPGKAASTRSSEVAPSSETTAFAPGQFGSHFVEARRLHGKHDQIGALGQLGVGVDRLAPELGGELRRAPGPGIGEEHPVDLAGPAARHGGSHAARSTEPDNHGGQPRRNRWPRDLD